VEEKEKGGGERDGGRGRKLRGGRRDETEEEGRGRWRGKGEDVGEEEEKEEE
jgi:hypothetical protein